jgi:hypothetical protein
MIRSHDTGRASALGVTVRGPLRIVLAVVFVSGTACQQQTREPSETLLRMKAQCRQAGAESRARWVKRYPGETFSNEPEYAYSERLHTCLYADSYSDSGVWLPGVPREDRFVEDVFANRVILELTLHSGAPIPATASDTCQLQIRKRVRCAEGRAFHS